jgi:hypothetical protein
VNKGSDMAVFQIENESRPFDEITLYQMGRYISSNEAVWRILSFPIHERHPTVIHLSDHLENGQRVYFTENNVTVFYKNNSYLLYKTIKLYFIFESVFLASRR